MRDHELRAFEAHLAGHNRSPRTMATYVAVVLSFADSVGAARRAWPPEKPDVEAFLRRPRLDGTRRSAATRNQELAAIRVFAKFAARDLGWPADPTAGIPFVREPARDPAVLSAGEVRQFLSAADAASSPARRARDVAVLAVLSQAGLRVHELVALDVEQVDAASATLVAVRGKGGTVHDVPLNVPTLALLKPWFAERGAIANPDEPALFVSSRGTRLSIRAVEHLVARLRDAVGTRKRVTPHTFRHSAATLALTLGADLSTVGDLLRHADLNTTRRYLHLVDERRRDAVAKLAVAIPPELLSGISPTANAATDGPAPRGSPMSNNVIPIPPSTLDDQHPLNEAAARQPWRPEACLPPDSADASSQPELPLAS